MDQITLCKGGCGNKAIYKGWCSIKWKKGNRICVTCPELEKKRASSISKYRAKEAKLGLNPMQNSEICAKNHSVERNARAAQSLKNLGRLRLLPQQTESRELREKRLKKIRKALRKLSREGKLNHQLETEEEKRKRYKKIADTMDKLSREGKLPMQNLTQVEKQRLGKKLSIILKKKFKNGELTINDWGKKYTYKNLTGREIKFRSKWEREVAEFLDKHKIHWEYESLRVQYYDRDRKSFRITIPDFYIPDLNLFIEVKGNGEFNSQNTKDKMDGIRKRNYKVMLFGKKQIKILRKNTQEMMLQIKELI